jgi:hypothetical protein
MSMIGNFLSVTSEKVEELLGDPDAVAPFLDPFSKGSRRTKTSSTSISLGTEFIFSSQVRLGRVTLR